VSGTAQAFGPGGVTLQNVNYNTPMSAPAGLGPFNFRFGESINSVQGASASSSVSENATVTIDPATGNVIVSASASGDASASETSTTFSRASSGASFNFNFTLTNRSYDYQITLGGISVNAPVGADTTASVGLFAGTGGFHENLSSDEPPVTQGSLTGTLMPGTYGVGASIDVTARKGSSAASYGFTLTLMPSVPEFEWVNTGGGTFATDSNWDPKHVPGASDGAVFDKPGTYTVSLDQDVSNAKVRMNGSGVNVAIDLAGHTYSANNLVVGGQPGDSVHLSFEDSGIVAVAASRAARSAASPAPITLSVPGIFAVRGGGGVDIAVPTSSGTASVDDGGILTASGANAQWLAQSLLLGTSGQATFSVSNKATVTTTFANIGVGAGGNASATVSDDSTNWASDRLVVGGQGMGSLSVLSSGHVHANNIVAGASPGTGIGTITVDTGPSMTDLSLLQQLGPTGSLVIGDQGTGHLIVRRTGDVQVEGTLQVARGVGGSGDVTITDPSSIVHAESLTIGDHGTLTVSNRGILATSEQLAGRTVIAPGGKIVVNTGGRYDAVTSLEVDGNLQIDSSSQVNVQHLAHTSAGPGTLTLGPGGTLSGTGTITVPRLVMLGGGNNFGGTLKPGHSPGTLTIDGYLEQDPGSTIKIEIAGTQPGQFDVLNVTGNASYAGDLLLSFQDGFAPHQGDTFTFLNTAGTMTGSFANVHLHDIAPGFQFNLEARSGGVEALVALNDAVSTRIPGDANDDGKVDFADLLTLAQNFNQDGTYSTGDFNLDGTVDFTDLLTLAQHFGQVAPPESLAQVSAVPEPTIFIGIPAILSLARPRRFAPARGGE
jgi:T5SS/PEP-CTERM-associated repeat protein